MKITVSTILLIILILELSISCKKEPVINPAKDITGHWKWLSTYSFDSDPNNFPLTPAKTGIHEELVFTADHKWAKFQNNIQTESGTYTIGHDIYIPNPGVNPFIYDSVVYYNGTTRYGWDY